MPLVGASALRARIDNLRNSFKPAGRRWAEDTVRTAKGRVPVRTGATRNSIRVKSATKRRAIVSVLYTGRFVEGDTKAHDIKAKGKALHGFQWQGRTVFAKKVHRRKRTGTPFLAPSAAQALDRSPIRDELIAAWNEGAP